MKKNGLEPCGWIKIIEEEPTVHMPLSGQVCLHLQKAPLTAPASLEMLKDYIQPMAAKAGLPKIGWHSFRHTVSAWGKKAGFTLEEVKTLLRHENIATTSQIYGVPQIEAKRGLQRRLVEFVKQQAELEGWKPEKDLWADCPTITTSVQ